MPLVELTAIIPDRPFDPDVFEREIRKVLEKNNRDVFRLYSRVWFAWNGPIPTMAQDVVVDSNDMYGEVYTDSDSLGNQKLMWADDGTPTRGWTSRRRMVFPRRYRASTRRGSILSQRRRKYGEIVGTYRINRHKIEARHFSKTVARLREKQFQLAVSQAFDRAARAF